MVKGATLAMAWTQWQYPETKCHALIECHLNEWPWIQQLTIESPCCWCQADNNWQLYNRGQCLR